MRVLTVGCLAGGLMGAGLAAAQDIAPPEPAWGTAWSTSTTAGAYSFAGPLTDGANGYRTCAAAGPCRASIDLPTGVFAHNLDLDACDGSPTSEVFAVLWECGPAPGPGTCNRLGEVRSGIAATPGCTRFNGFITQTSINNYNYTYFVEVAGTNDTIPVAADFRGVRVVWTREVSPAPAIATFSDVPTNHPYFRFIEALADARITGGCGNGRFCPADPVTRGEMAVFLSTALGLNFPD
jgi:hypothetical protein